MKATFVLCLVLVLAAVVFCDAKKAKKVGVPEGSCTQDGEYLADDYDCRVYYECDPDLVPVPNECDEGLCWYQAARECVWANEYPCTTPCLDG